MNFVPDQSEAQEVPYYEDAIKKEGWQGHRTEKSTEKLRAEVGEAIGRLGGLISFFQGGVFRVGDVERPGLQVHYSVSGHMARLDIAALPTRSKSNREKSLRMALYMLKIAFDGMWFLQQLSPGYAPLMPFMIADNQGHTISQLWAESSTMKKLLPPPDADFDVIDAE
jgi:hypothetical protein